MALAFVKHISDILTGKPTETSNIFKINMKRAAEDALRKNGIRVSHSELEKLFGKQQDVDLNSAVIHLKHKANMLVTQTTKIIGLLLKEDPQFAKVTMSAQNVIHTLMNKRDVFIEETIPQYEQYKKDLKTRREEDPFKNPGGLEAKIENIQDKIKNDISEMKELYINGQYQAQIVHGLEKLSIKQSELSANDLSMLSSAELFKALAVVNKDIGPYMEDKSTYSNNMIEIRPS